MVVDSLNRLSWTLMSLHTWILEPFTKLLLYSSAFLFQGQALEVPEIVPFRLTHNMTDAMGPMKYEGFFRCACEAVMRLLRQQREPLLRLGISDDSLFTVLFYKTIASAAC